MHIWSTLKNFLYDKDYFIANFQNKIYIYNFDKVLFMDSSKIILIIKDKTISILGTNLLIRKSLNKELLIEGIFKGLSYE